MPGNENYEDPFMYVSSGRHHKPVTRGRGRTPKSRIMSYGLYDGASRGDMSLYRNEHPGYLSSEDMYQVTRKRIKASHFENFIKKCPGGTQICILCKMENNHTICQGALKWFSVKSKRGPGRPCNKQAKNDRPISAFLNVMGSSDFSGQTRVVSIKTDPSSNADPLKIKIDMSKTGSSSDINGVRKEDLDSPSIEGCGFYVHVECCRWTTQITLDMEMFKAERYILKGLGCTCSHCNMNGATVFCRSESCKKKYHLVCSFLAKCVPDISTSSVICVEHLGGKTNGEAKCAKCKEDLSHSTMLHCFTCGSHYHQACLKQDVPMKSLVIAGWQCDNCISCQLCCKPLTQTPQLHTISCVVCCKPSHLECIQAVQLPMPMPPHQWRCKLCKNCTDCGVEVALQEVTDYTLPFILCNSCHAFRYRGVRCSICYKAIFNYTMNKIDGVLKCERCKCLVHPLCEPVDAASTVKEYQDPGNIYICPACRPGGKPAIVNRAMFLNSISDNGTLTSLDDNIDENSQDSMSITSENDEMSSFTPMSSSHNSPGSSSVDSYVVIPPKKGQRGLGIKLARPTRKLPKIPSADGVYQEKRDGGSPQEVVLFDESDQYTLNKDLCSMCGSIGVKEDGLMLTCHQCGKCCHSYCAGKSVTPIMLKVGWRCQDCRICEACSKPNDEARMLLCEDCELSFHTLCLNPPLEQIPSGAWRCSWCVKCVKCKASFPGLHSVWYEDYTVCGPCHSNIFCLKCNQEYCHNDFVIKCSKCEHTSHGKCEGVLSEENLPKKFVCSLCEQLVKKEDKPKPKLQIATYPGAKHPLPTAMPRDPRMMMGKPLDKDSLGGGEDMDKNSMSSFEFMKQKHELYMKNKRQEKDQKASLMEHGMPSVKEFSQSPMYQQIIKEFTGTMAPTSKSSRRGRGRGARATNPFSPNKDPNAPRVRGRPRGSRNKASQRRGKVVTPDIYQQFNADDTINFNDFTTMGRSPPFKQEGGISQDNLMSTVKCLPQRYRQIMMRVSGCSESLELKISRHLNPEREQIEPSSSGPQLLGPCFEDNQGNKKELRAKKRGTGKHEGSKLMDAIKKEQSPANVNELTMNFFGEDLVSPRAGDVMSPMMQQSRITLSMTTPPHQSQPPPPPPPHSIKPNLLDKPKQVATKPMDIPLTPRSVHTTPTPSPKPESKPQTPIKQEAPEPLDLSKINIDEITVCPESPSSQPHADTLPEYNNRELVSQKQPGQEEEEEEKTSEAISTIFWGIFSDDGLDIDDVNPKGSPVYNPPAPDAPQLTFKSITEELDECGGVIPSEVSAILESIEAKPMGTELGDTAWERTKDETNDLGVNLDHDLEVPEDILTDIENFNFPDLFDDITMKKLDSGNMKAPINERSEIDKMLDVPVTTKKAPNSPSMTIKTWEEEERKGTLGTVPQLLYACAEMGHMNLKMQYKDPIERYKVINRAWQSLSKEEKKIYMNNSKKNKVRKMGAETEYHMDQQPATPSPWQQPFDGSHLPPNDRMMMGDQAEMIRQNHRRQRLYETQHRRQPGKAEMLPAGAGDPVWNRFPRPDEGSTVTVGPIGPASKRENPGTPGPMQQTAVRSPMNPRGYSPMGPMMHPNAMVANPNYIRQFDHHSGQWISGPNSHNPLRHLPPQAVMAHQNMPPGAGGIPGQSTFVDQYGGVHPMTPEAQPPQPPKTKKRTKKKKEKVSPSPVDSQVTLENFPPHLRFGTAQPSPSAMDFPHNMEYSEQFRNSMNNKFAKTNSGMMKSPKSEPLERPKSLNISNSPNSANKSHPNTPNKGNSRNSSPRINKPEDMANDIVEPQMQHKQNLRMALEQKKQQSNYAGRPPMSMQSLHFPLNTLQFVQFRMQHEWLKKFNAHVASDGIIPPAPQHLSTLHAHQIHTLYRTLLEQYMYQRGILISSAGGIPHMPPHEPIVEEEKKPKTKKRKKKKAETPVKKETVERNKMAKLGPNIIMQPGAAMMSAGSMKVNSPQTSNENYMMNQGMSVPFQPGIQGNMSNPRMLNQHSTNQKHLNMRSPGPATLAGPHVNEIPGQHLQHLMANNPNNPHPRFMSPQISANHHFHEGYDIDPHRTTKSNKAKSKTKNKESLQLSISKGAEVPLQAGSPRFQCTTTYQHQIKVEDNQDFSEPQTPKSQTSQTPTSCGTPVTGDPFDVVPLTPNAYEGKRRKRKTKAESDEIKTFPSRYTNKNLPSIMQPDMRNMVDVVVRGVNKSSASFLRGTYGQAFLEGGPDYYTEKLKAIHNDNKIKRMADLEKKANNMKVLMLSEKMVDTTQNISQTVLTPQQEKVLCQKFGVSSAEAQHLYLFQQHQSLLSISHHQDDKSPKSESKPKVLEQIRILQESRDKRCNKTMLDKVKQESVAPSKKDSIQLIFKRSELEKEIKTEAGNKDGATNEKVPPKPNRPMLELTQPVPQHNIKLEPSVMAASNGRTSSDSRSISNIMMSSSDFSTSLKPCNPPTDEKTTRVINLHKAFQMLSDMLGMKLKRDNIASLNELRVQNIIPGSLPNNLVCYNCVIALHPNKLKHINSGRPYYGIKDEHGATFCSDHCLAQYYCKKLSSMKPLDEQRTSVPVCPPPLKQHSLVEKAASSPGKRRREVKWRYWKLEDISYETHVEDEDAIWKMFKQLNEEQSLKTVHKDGRVCLLCGATGDGRPNGASRLLNYSKNVWMHLNCILWSNEVYEARDGTLVNVPQMSKRAQDTVCSYCNRIGATVGCAKQKCGLMFHFLCARHQKCVFYFDKTVYCKPHATSHNTDMICTDFTVKRRVVIDRDIYHLISNEGFKEPGDKFRVGPLIFHHPGHVLNNTSNFHTRNIIYPFKYSVTRVFWSPEALKRRTRYHCAIDIDNEHPIFKISYTKLNNTKVEFQDRNLDSLWRNVLEPLSDLRSKNANSLKFHLKFHSGSYFHGLTQSTIVRIIEGLPGTDKLEGYTFTYGRIETITLEHLVPLNPTESARTEKYLKHTKRSSGHRQITTQGSHPPSNLWVRELGTFNEMLPYQKSIIRASQYRRLKNEWKQNVLLRRSGIQGLGLYARRFIERNTMVIEYVGQLIRTALCDVREEYYNSRNIGCYMFKIDDEVAIDATLTGGPARYINHSCEPNCVAEIVTFEREKKIIIISNRKIRQGEELTYDYKFDFEDDSEKIPCNCGSVICRKWMN